MQWLLPFPGDWHVLYNYQKVLLKIYGDAGLIQLSKVSGHRGETLTSLVLASHFKKTHHFILQSYEAIYRNFLKSYLSSLGPSSSKDVLSKARRFSSLLADVKSEDDLEKLHAEIHDVFDIALSGHVDGFTRFMVSLCSRDKTCNFWFQYLTTNCLVYMALFASIRNGDWVLRRLQ